MMPHRMNCRKMNTFNHRCLLAVIVTASLMISACSSASTPETDNDAFVVESALATIAAPMPTPEPTEPEMVDTTDVADVPALPEPTFIGSPDFKSICEHGPTGVSAETDVSRAAPPGSMLNYTAVAYLQYAAKLNRWATEDCALQTGEPPVHYTLHIRHIPELELYGALAKNSTNLKYDKIQAAWTAYVPTPPTATPTHVPTPDLQATIDAAIRQGQ